MATETILLGSILPRPHPCQAAIKELRSEDDILLTSDGVHIGCYRVESPETLSIVSFYTEIEGIGVMGGTLPLLPDSHGLLLSSRRGPTLLHLSCFGVHPALLRHPHRLFSSGRRFSLLRPADASLPLLLPNRAQVHHRRLPCPGAGSQLPRSSFSAHPAVASPCRAEPFGTSLHPSIDLGGGAGGKCSERGFASPSVHLALPSIPHGEGSGN